MNIALEDVEIAAITSYITPETLICLDIDNTLLRAKTMLGSAQWFGYIVDEAMKSGLSRQDAVVSVYDLYLRVSVFTDMVLIEKNLPTYLAQWSEKALGVIGLTARHISNGEQTMKQIHRNNISFSPTALVGWETEIPFTTPAVYQNGILFTSELNSKGDALAGFLSALAQTSHRLPKRLIFVDDLEKNTDSVRATLQEHYEVITLRYGAEDTRVAAFDPLVAKIQLDNLGKILPDKVAVEFAAVIANRAHSAR